MGLSVAAESVLRSILAYGGDINAGGKARPRAPAPSDKELFELCELIAVTPSEEQLQCFFEKNVGFMTGMFGTNDNSDIAVLFKPSIGTQYRADFCVLQAFQGGAVAHLIELESSHESLFTKRLTPARRLQSALGQIDDWRQWIERNRVHYARELMRTARELPLYGAYRDGDAGVRFVDADRAEELWSAFGGFEDPSFSYAIVIGRWSQLSREQKDRLVTRNRHNDPNCATYTYEQLARQANGRLERDEF